MTLGAKKVCSKATWHVWLERDHAAVACVFVWVAGVYRLLSLCYGGVSTEIQRNKTRFRPRHLIENTLASIWYEIRATYDNNKNNRSDKRP